MPSRAIQSFLFACLLFPSTLFSLTQNQINDRDLANAIWGNPQNWAQNPHPDANYFDHPIADGLGARPLGMGEAFGAISDELSGIWYNPAGLTHMPQNEVVWMSGDRLVNDAPWMGFAGASYMLDNRMVFALSFERPYHPVGAYPAVLAGSYGFSSDKWSGTGPVVIPGNPGQKTNFTDITNTQVQQFLENIYRYYINPPVQENDYVFTFATPLSADRNLSLGINVKYLQNDPVSYVADGALLDQEQGWGIDLGFLYQIPLTSFGRQLSFGLDIRDMAAQVKFGNSREVTIPSVASVSTAWQTRDFLNHSKLNLAADLIYINDPGLDFADNHRMDVGGEMWFFNDHIGPRAGYSIFFDQPSRGSIGISFRYLVGIDYAYLFQTQNEDGSHWFTVNYRWGGPKIEKPLPDVSATVDPPIFSPKNGEVATFTLSAVAKSGIDRWSLLIIDHNNKVVKTYQDRGTPPSQILWEGEDQVYKLLPDGEYTFLFSATDNLGASNSSPVQSIKIYTVPPKAVVPEDMQNLRKLIKAQQVEEESVEDKVQKNLQAQLAALIKKKAVNQTLPDLAKVPEQAQAASGTAQAQADLGAPSAFSYPVVNDIPFPKTTIKTSPDGKKSFVVEYETAQSMPRYILSDIADIVSLSAKDVGKGVDQYDVQAKYGSQTLRVQADSGLALNFSRGFINESQFLKQSTVTLNGEYLNPSY